MQRLTISRLSDDAKHFRVRKLTTAIVTRFKNDSLFRNSVYLMLSTAVMAFFGFIFWIIAARAYTPAQIGFATALISATVMLSSFSMLGFNTAIVRYLPRSKAPNVTISTAIISVGIATLIISFGYVLGIHRFAPAFVELADTPAYGMLFLIFMVMVSLNSLTDSVFIAYRASRYNLIVYTFFSLVKVGLPLLLVRFEAYGIFFAYIGSIVVSLLLSFWFMRKHFAYRFRWVIDKHVVKDMGKFSLANYISSFMATLPALSMPGLIVTKLGPEQAAYFYMASTIASLLYVIPQATTQALLAEGAHDEKGIMSFVKGASKLISLLLLPAVLLIFIAGHIVLLVFGKTYATESASLLNILAVTGIFMSINMVGATIMRIRHQMKELIALNASYLVITLLLAYPLLERFGVLGAGWTLLGGQLCMCMLYTLLIVFNRLPKRVSATA